MDNLLFKSFPNLATGRLILRQLKIEDENEIFLLRSDERVLTYLDRPKAKTIDDARQFIAKINEGIEKADVIYWAIALKNNPKLVGTICLWKISRVQRKAELGFELLPDFQGKGIIQEALPAVIDYAFRDLQLQTIEAEVDRNNVKSIKLLEKHDFNRDLNINKDEIEGQENLKMLVYRLKRFVITQCLI